MTYGTFGYPVLLFTKVRNECELEVLLAGWDVASILWPVFILCILNLSSLSCLGDITQFRLVRFVSRVML